MTIREYLDNPMGKGDSSIPNRKELIDSLEIKYQKLIRTKGNSIKINIYVAGNKSDDIYFHMIIPTETDRTNSYDVVFLFSDPKREHKNELSISNYDIKVFSNSPSFAYTFAHVYMKNGLFIDTLKRKMEKDIVKKAPEVRNRFGIVNYEKYSYFGARFILDSKLMNRAFMGTKSKKFSPEVLHQQVRSLDVILAEYKKAEAKLRHSKKDDTSRQRATSGKSVMPKTRAIKEVKKKSPKSKMGKINKVKKI